MDTWIGNLPDTQPDDICRYQGRIKKLTGLDIQYPAVRVNPADSNVHPLRYKDI